MQKKIFLFSGFSDIEVAGNQSLKNNIKYLAEFGYKVTVFTFFPKNYPNLINPKEVFGKNVEYHRVHGFVAAILYFGKRIKDLFGKNKKVGDHINKIGSGGVVNFYTELNILPRILYISALYFFYIPIELSRAAYYYYKEGADLFYGVNWQGVILASLAGKIFGKPSVARFHGETSLRPEYLDKLKWRFYLFDEISALKAPVDIVVMLNDGTQGDFILRKLGVPQEKVLFLMNGMDTDDLTLPKNWNRSAFKKEIGLENKKVILMVSRLAAWKRVDRGIKCVNSLVLEYGLKDVVLLVIGGGPEKNNLIALTKEIKIEPYVKFLGEVPHKELCKYYSIADVFLNLFDISNLGNPLLEAMYSGVPIVTVDDGSTKEVLKEGESAFFVKVKSMENELPRKVKLLLENDTLRETMGQNSARAFKNKVLTWEQRMRVEDKVINKLFKKNA